MNKIICKNCSKENQVNASLCWNCDEELRNYNYYKKDFKDYYQLFSSDNLKILEKIPLTDSAYDSIISSIVDIGESKLPVVPLTPSLPVLMDITKPYARVKYDQENRHPDYFSYYSFNNIFINRNIPQNLLGGAIIHEFSHHLFNELIEQTIMHLLNVDKNLYVESFAWYLTLQNDYLKIVNEYISHRTQQYFFTEDFIGYTSIKELINNNDELEDKKIQTSLSVAHTISEDIIHILEHFITRSNPNIIMPEDNVLFDIVKLDEQNKLNAIYTIIFNTFEVFCKNKRDMLSVLDELNNSFIYYNI